jgi:hypothetical protein
MEIVRVIYQGFSTENNQYADCIMMIRLQAFSVSKVFEIAVAEKYPVCSEIHLDILIENECKKVGGEFWEAYLEAAENMYSLTCFVHDGSRMPTMIPRFSEADFATIFEELGGEKIAECSTETPDFRLGDIIMELKDLQQDSLKNKDRQEHIAAIFRQHLDRCINLDPNADYGELSKEYHNLIQNAVHNHLKKASSQIKTYRKTAAVAAAGMIYLNTGMFSLPHDLFRAMVADLLLRRTKTIKFIFVFSQVMQGNGFDQYAIFKSEFIGVVPANIHILQQKVNELIDHKMTSMIRDPGQILTLDEQQPISFEKFGKIYYWNPGPVPDSRFAN